jgi:hypothetical protein
MVPLPREKNLFCAIFLGVLALHLALILSVRLYPFTDIPNHLAAATIVRYIGEPSNHFVEYFSVDTFLKPNTFHPVFCSLALFPSPEFANRIYLALYAILLPVSMYLIIRKLGGNPWFSLLSFLLLYNYNVSWGFVGFVFAIPLVLLFCYFFIFDARGVTGASRIVWAAAFLVLLYFVHLLAALFCLLLLFLALAPGFRRIPRAFSGGLLASLPLIVLIARWWRGETRNYPGPGILQFLSGYYRNSYLESVVHRKSLLVFDNYHLSVGARGYIVATVFSLSIVVPAIILLVRGRAQSGRPRFGAPLPLALGAFLCFLLLPNEIPRQSILYERFSSLLLLALVIYAGFRAPGRLHRAAVAGIVAISLFHFALWADYFIDFNRENAGFDRAFLRPSGDDGKLAGLVYDYTYRGRGIFIHFPSYYLVWEKGIATSRVAEYRFSAIRKTAGGRAIPRYLEWVGKGIPYDGRYRDMDYLLMRGGGAPGGFELERSAGKWSLYERAAPPPRTHGCAVHTHENN